MSGIDFDDEIPIQTRTLLEPLGVPASRAKVVNDGVVALWGGSPKKRAVILQLGTAFTAGYRDGFGTETPFDHLNAGVLIEIRRIILASCARVWDGRLPKSILPELVLRHFEYDDPIPLIKVGVRNALDRWHLLTVIDPWREAVERGDAVSKKIARDAAKVYVQDLDFLIRKIGGGRVDVVLGGGLLRNGPEYFRACIADGVRAKHPQVTIHLPHLSPAIGAALMAAHTDGRDYPTLYRRAQQTVPS
jgi:N-acetylglucosamine kinase-like BadF-type ATPase